jgi:hypothetical protein
MTADVPSWPGQDPKNEFAKIRYQGVVDVYKSDQEAAQALEKDKANAQIALDKARSDADIELRKSDTDAEIASQAAFHQALIDLTKGSIDRSRSAAEAVRNAAAAIGVIYGTVLGIAFSVDHRSSPPSEPWL